MRIPPSILGLLALASGLVGCSQTGGLRAVAPSDVKTTASVGDKSLPVVAGLPGEDSRVAAAGAGSRGPAGARISGRVYDEDGEPVRNAVVRLAMSGAAGGKLVHANTDRSGAFTLRGVRPGSSYTVIAEYHGEQGMMTGRAEAEAPETDLQISLRPRDSQPGGGGEVAAAPEGSRVRSVARSDEPDDATDARRPSRTQPARPVRPRLDAEPEGVDDPPSSSEPQDEAPDPGSFEDDGENPLPPAREISRVSARVDELPPAYEVEGAPRNLPDNFIEAGGQGGAARAKATLRERARPTWSDVASQVEDVPLDEQVAQTNAVRREVAPPAETATAPEPEPPVATPAPEPVAAAAPSRPASTPADLDARRKAPYCEYDADQRRVLSFAMLDMSGKKVSLRDFDADLILLDFWGSWCVQCRPALEHMKELQAKMGGKKLQVVSVAYEKTPKEGRPEKLAEVVRAMGLNFPVLMTDFSDPCPVREALAIDVFPTMILLDREGRILRRERGATPITLGNIDRAIDDYLAREGRPQYARREARGRATR